LFFSTHDLLKNEFEHHLPPVTHSGANTHLCERWQKDQQQQNLPVTFLYTRFRNNRHAIPQLRRWRSWDNGIVVASCHCEASCHHRDLGQNASSVTFIATQWWPAHQTLSGPTQSRVHTKCLPLDICHYSLAMPLRIAAIYVCKVKGKTGKYSSCPYSTKVQCYGKFCMMAKKRQTRFRRIGKSITKFQFMGCPTNSEMSTCILKVVCLPPLVLVPKTRWNLLHENLPCGILEPYVVKSR